MAERNLAREVDILKQHVGALTEAFAGLVVTTDMQLNGHALSMASYLADRLDHLLPTERLSHRGWLLDRLREQCLGVAEGSAKGLLDSVRDLDGRDEA
ncbi:MAG: hypothetical protein AB7P52_17600 [Alphaproteobacteria bacterium]